MARRRHPELSRLVVAAFSRHVEALDWATARLQESFGPVERTSPDYDFHHTTDYETSMGPNLRKRLIVFEPACAADALPRAKNIAAGLEQELVVAGRFPEPRPLNLDPGLLQLGKFLLATSKDQSQRIYL